MTKIEEKMDQSVKLFGLNLFGKDKAQLLKILDSGLSSSKRPFLVATPNPEQIIQARADRDFQRHLQAMDLLLPDGIGLVATSRIWVLTGRLTTGLRTRLAGVDVVKELLRLAAHRRLKVLLIGGRDYQTNDQFEIDPHQPWQLISLDGDQLGQGSAQDDSQDSANFTTKLYWTSGFTDLRNSDTQVIEAEQARLADQIKSLRPDLVLVALGAPLQERWLIENQDLLAESGTRLAMAVGGSFDFILGKVERAPEEIQNLGLEWAYRLLKEPWRARRQLRLIEFLGLLVRILLRIDTEEPQN